jgi:hypothetical protein
MPQLVGLGRGMNPAPVGSAGPQIQPLTSWYTPAAAAYISALEATGATITDARKYTLGRALERITDNGCLDLGLALHIVGPTEACFLVNAMNTARNATKQGSPTFVADSYVTTGGSSSDYYATDFQLQEVPQNSNSLLMYSPNNTTAAQSAPDMGATDGTANFFINAKASNGNALRCGSFSGAVNIGTATQFPGGAAFGMNRRDSGTIYGYEHGINRVSSSTGTTASSSSLPVTILKQNGSGASTTRQIASAWLGEGLTDTQFLDLAAIMRNIDESLRFGEPMIQPAGYGTPVVEADVIVVGLSVASFCAAYQAVRLGRSVAMVGLAHESTVSCLGGHPAAGLGWLDSQTLADVSGLFRTIITWMNDSAGLSDNQTQLDMSLSPVWWNRAMRHMADPNKADANLPGLDIPIYLSTGIASITKSGTSFQRLTTNDGRVFQASGSRAILIGGDYIGDSVYYLGLPNTQGTEAQGTAPGEDLNGYLPADIEKLQDDNGNFYDVDCYVVEGNPASGLLPTLVELPSITAGDPDPSLQSINFRINLVASTNASALPWSYLAQPAGYNALDYEPQARALKAITDASRTPTLDDIFSYHQLHDGSRYDFNSGPLPYTDMPQSGVALLQAGANLTARNAVELDILKYDTGLIWWILNSGDSRIPAGVVTAMNGFQLPAIQLLDPPEGFPLFWPCMIYDRDPVFQLKNTFNYNGHDTYDTTGDPRSLKTVAMCQYRVDRHFPRLVGSGGLIYKQGPLNDVNNLSVPVPLEAIVPDEADFADGIFPACPAFTKIAWYSGRMEPTLGMMGQMAAFIADYALTNDCSVQDVDYPTVRTAALAAPDAVPLVLAQTN